MAPSDSLWMTQGTLIILDVGRNVDAADEKNNFFAKARACTARIIERKILSEEKNVIAIILLGSKKTNNNMALQCDSSFKNIEILTKFQSPSWQMIRNLPEKCHQCKGDWFEALVVAANYYKNDTSGIKFASKKIILVTNFKRKALFDQDAAEVVLNGFKDDGFEVDILGPDIYTDDFHKKSIRLARQFIKVTNGVTETFENTMQYLLFHKKRTMKVSPWNVDLSIGPNIKIPVSAFIRIKDEAVVKKWEKAVIDPLTNTASTSEAIETIKEYITPDQKKVDFMQKITGYHYGQKIIPLSDFDQSMLYQPGQKCLSLYGFTKADNIQWQNLNGDGLYYVFGRKDDKKAQHALRCLIECLHELNLVGIARRVYNNNNAPKMYVLNPVIDNNNFICLSMIALCYKEEIKQMSFPPTNLKKYQCTDEQVNAFVDLIKAMDLTKAYDDTFDDAEAFPIAECVSPSAQYVLDCLVYRAMNPGEPLPKPRQEIMSLFEVPPLLAKNAKDPLDKLKKLLNLKKIEPKPKANKNIRLDMDELQRLADIKSEESISDIPKIQMPTPKGPMDIKNISTLDPIGDFKVLKSYKSLAELGPQMIKVIENMINFNVDGNFSKVLEVIKCLRSEYIKSDPSDYNAWLQKFKSEIEGNKKDVLNLLIENKASYILKDENALSNYDNEQSHEDSQLFENDTIPQSTELTISSEVQNMFDD